MNFEPQLRGLIESINDSSFNKVSLKQFKKIPKTLRPAFLSHNDSDVRLAAEVYADLLKKSLSFCNEIEEGRLKPNDEGLKLCEER